MASGSIGADEPSAPSSLEDILAEVQRLEEQGKLVEASALLRQAQSGLGGGGAS